MRLGLDHRGALNKLSPKLVQELDQIVETLNATFAQENGEDEYGILFGDPAATNIIIDDVNGIQIRNGSDVLLYADTQGNLSLTGTLTVLGGNIADSVTVGTTALVPASTIAGWRYGATTYIDGGDLYTGTVTANKITVGLNGNIFTNSEFRSGLQDGGGTWVVGYGSDACTWNIGVHYADPWTLQDSGTGYLYTGETPAAGTYRLVWGPRFPAQAGKYYELSGYLGNHRSSAAQVELHFFNSDDTDIGAIYGNGIGQDKAGGMYLSGYGRSYTIGVAPAGTVYMKPYLRLTSSNEANPYLFYTRLCLAEAHEGQTLPSEWGGVTTITKDSITVTTLAAIQANIGAAHIDGVLDIGTAGGIYQGSGSFASPTTGLKIWRDGSDIGRIAGYKATVEQWGATTEGILTAGAGDVTLDATGIRLTPANLADEYDNCLLWNNANATDTGQLGFGSFDPVGAWDKELLIRSETLPTSDLTTGIGRILLKATGHAASPHAHHSARVLVKADQLKSYVQFGDEDHWTIYFDPDSGGMTAAGDASFGTSGDCPILLNAGADYGGSIKGTAAAWSRRWGFLSNVQSDIGGFGAYYNGTAPMPTYFWIGPSAASPYMALDGSGITLYKAVSITPQASANALWIHAVTGQWAGVFDNFQTASYGLLVRAGTLATWEPALQVMAKDASTSLFNVYPAGTVVYNTLYFGADIDTNLYRSAANCLKTDDAFYCNSIHPSTAMEWSHLDKTGSSLADLATKSAGALDSGTLLDARLSSNVAMKNASIVPTTDNSYDLGDSTHRWQDVFFYLPNTATAATVFVTAESSGELRKRSAGLTKTAGQAIVILDGDGVSTHTLEFTDGLLTSYSLA